MRESLTYGSVRGVPGDRHSYRNNAHRFRSLEATDGGPCPPYGWWIFRPATGCATDSPGTGGPTGATSLKASTPGWRTSRRGRPYPNETHVQPGEVGTAHRFDRPLDENHTGRRPRLGAVVRSGAERAGIPDTTC